jgi:hypothetical protein
MKTTHFFFKTLILILTLLTNSNVCKSNNDYTENMNNTTDTSITTKKLLEIGDNIVHNPFMPVDTNSIEWIKSPVDLKKMMDIIKSNTEPSKAKFLAIMVLKKNGHNYLLSIDKTTLIKYTMEALKNNYTDYYSDWGFMGEYESSLGGTNRLTGQGIGSAGSIFEIIGKEALPELCKLINDVSPIIYKRYNFPHKIQPEDRTEKKDSLFNVIDNKNVPILNETSRAQLWNTLRIKDFAALYISTIMKYNLHFDENLIKRDIEMNKMMKDLNLN